MSFSTRSGPRPDASTKSSPAMSVKLAMRKLWSDHVVWTRLYIIAAVDATPDKLAKIPQGARTPAGVSLPAEVFQAVGPMLGDAEAAAGRLLRNQEDIGDAIVPYFGRDAGKEVTRLLKEHIMIAVQLVDAAKKDHKENFAKFDQKWTRNADEIATYLSRANENWPREDVASLLHLHLKLTKEEVTARLQRDWGTDVQKFDDIFAEAMTIADALADGLVKKFPEKFQAS